MIGASLLENVDLVTSPTPTQSDVESPRQAEAPNSPKRSVLKLKKSTSMKKATSTKKNNTKNGAGATGSGDVIESVGVSSMESLPSPVQQEKNNSTKNGAATGSGDVIESSMESLPRPVQQEMPSTSTAPKREGRSIAYFFDGTWNDPEDNTNVVKMFEGCSAKKKYMRGIGSEIDYKKNSFSAGDYETDMAANSSKTERILGSTLMAGDFLTRNVIEAYAWLCREISSQDDRVYLFGFSRGAYTARSVAGLIGTVGVVNGRELVNGKERDETAMMKIAEDAVIEVYRCRRKKPEEFLQKHMMQGENEWRKKFEIHFVGVFDTVGALGVPSMCLPGLCNMIRWLEDGIHGFSEKNTYLGPHVRNACHAVALDDAREVFEPTMWANIPSEVEANSVGKQGKHTKQVKQVWFTGAHSDVGGGYEKEPELSSISMRWMIENAMSFGLEFKTDFVTTTKEQATGKALTGKIHHPEAGKNIFCRTLYAARCSTDARAGAVKLDVVGGSPQQALHWSSLVRCTLDQGYVPMALQRLLADGEQQWPTRLPVVKSSTEIETAILSEKPTRRILRSIAKKTRDDWYWTQTWHDELKKLLQDEDLWMDVDVPAPLYSTKSWPTPCCESIPYCCVPIITRLDCCISPDNRCCCNYESGCNRFFGCCSCCCWCCTTRQPRMLYEEPEDD